MKRALTRWFLRDWPLKLISLGLALGLWLLLVPSEKTSSEKSLLIPLEILNVPAGLEVVGRVDRTIEVTLRAPVRVLDEIGPSSLAARIDLERGSIHQEEYPLNASMIAVPQGADIVKISPSKVTIRLERTAEALIEVHATLRGKPAQGFRVSRVGLEPSSVAVRGPESLVRAGDAATTSPVDISGLGQSTIFDADIILPRPELRIVSAVTSARVEVVIEEDKAAPAAAARKKRPAGK